MPLGRRRTTGALLASALIFGGGVLASGCGSSSDDGGTKHLAVLDQAASATAKQKTFHIDTVVNQTLQGKQLTYRTQGDANGERVRVKIDLADLFRQLGGAGAAGTMLDRVGGADALTGQIVVDGKTVLIDLPALQKGLKAFAGKSVGKWATVDLTKLGKVGGVDVAGLLSAGTGTESAIGYLRALTGDLQKVGTETIDGVSTTHYRATLDFKNIPDDVPARLKASLEQTAALLEKTKASTKIPVDVWLDAEGLLRREVVAQTVAGAKSTTTVNLSDYGKAVKIAVPPASERYDLLAVIEQISPGALKGLQQAPGAGTSTGASTTN